MALNYYVTHNISQIMYMAADSVIIIRYKAITIEYYDSVGTAVAQLVEALRYKSEGRGFDSRWCHWNFSLT